jgi:hypothetical protein
MSPLLGLYINQVVLLLGIGLFVFVMVSRMRRGTVQSGRGPRLGGGWQSDRDSLAQAQRSREPIGSVRLRSTAASPDHESWEVEMHRLARQLKGEIETKMRALERLIQLADEAHARLDASLERTKALGSSNEGQATTALAGTATAHDVRFARNSAQPGRTRSSMRDTNVAGRQNLGHQPGDDLRFERVYALADAGFSATKIAGQIGSQIGEVELILSLRQSNEAA